MMESPVPATAMPQPSRPSMTPSNRQKKTRSKLLNKRRSLEKSVVKRESSELKTKNLKSIRTLFRGISFSREK
jgi:hypothetical protein